MRLTENTECNSTNAIRILLSNRDIGMNEASFPGFYLILMRTIQ